MKQVAILLLLVCSVGSLHAADETSWPEEGTRLSLWIPGFLVKTAAGIAADKTGDPDLSILKNIGSVSLVVREGSAYSGTYDKKIERKLRRMDRREYEELVAVHDEGAEVHLHIRENRKGTVKRMIVLVDDHESTFVFVSMHCSFKPEDLQSVASMALK